MRLANTVNVLDVEHDSGRLIEIGLTTVALKKRQILKTYSLPIKIEFELDKDIVELTGWTTTKLRKQGITREEAVRRLDNYGSSNRLLVTDHSDEIPFLEESLGRSLSPHRLNVSILLALQTGNDINLGLEQMLSLVGLEFEGRQHFAADDSRNIARLFLRLLTKLAPSAEQHS